MNDGQFKINNVVYTAKTLKPVYDSLASEDSGRTDDGVMRITWIFRRMRKLEITMPPMTPSEATALLSAVQGQEYSITYHDILSNSDKTLSVYTTNSSADCYSGIVRNGLYQNITFNAIELGGEA